MLSESSKESILKELDFMYELAKEKGLWFYTSYQDMWFSPKELKEKQANDQFVWGAANWRLRDPHERLEELYNHKESIDNQIWAFKNKMG